MQLLKVEGTKTIIIADGQFYVFHCYVPSGHDYFRTCLNELHCFVACGLLSNPKEHSQSRLRAEASQYEEIEPCDVIPLDRR